MPNTLIACAKGQNLLVGAKLGHPFRNQNVLSANFGQNCQKWTFTDKSPLNPAENALVSENFLSRRFNSISAFGRPRLEPPRPAVTTGKTRGQTGKLVVPL